MQNAETVLGVMGATNAMAVNVNQMCNGGAAAMDIALGYLAGRCCDDAALVTTADRFSPLDSTDGGVTMGSCTVTVVRRSCCLAERDRSGLKPGRRLPSQNESRCTGGTDPFTASPTTPDGPLSIRRTKKAYLQLHGKDRVGVIQERGARRALDTALGHASCDLADAKILILPNLGRKILQSLYWPLFGVARGLCSSREGVDHDA
jgi:3-oxoacyl-[acyl-carrier-protein] synthase III